MKGDPSKLKHICPNWSECLNNQIQEYGGSYAEEDLAFNNCCGCISCVLFREKVGCGEDCFIREKYPQYQAPDSELFQMATGVDLDDVIEDLERELDYDPVNARPINDDTVSQEILYRIAVKQKKFREALGWSDPR